MENQLLWLFLTILRQRYTYMNFKYIFLCVAKTTSCSIAESDGSREKCVMSLWWGVEKWLTKMVLGKMNLCNVIPTVHKMHVNFGKGVSCSREDGLNFFITNLKGRWHWKNSFKIHQTTNWKQENVRRRELYIDI